MGLQTERRPLVTDGADGGDPLPGAIDTENNHFPEAVQGLDEREAFLLRASAAYDLVELGEPVDEVFDGLIDQFLHIVFPLPALPALAAWAEGLSANPGWKLAAIEYHVARGTRPSLSRLVVRVVKGEAVFHPDVDFYRENLDPAVSFDAAYRAIAKQRGRQ